METTAEGHLHLFKTEHKDKPSPKQLLYVIQTIHLSIDLIVLGSPYLSMSCLLRVALGHSVLEHDVAFGCGAATEAVPWPIYMQLRAGRPSCGRRCHCAAH